MARSQMGALMRTRHLATALLVGSTLLVAACQLLVGIEDERGAERPPVTVADDGGADADAASACQLTHPPSAPDAPPDGGEQTLSFAIQTFRVRPKDLPPIGYDLDDRCSAAADTPSPDLDCSGATKGDDPGGVDNAFGLFAEGLVGLTGTNSSPDPFARTFNAWTTIGRQTLQITLALYNLQSDDAVVAVSVLQSGPFLTTLGADAGAPQWDGGDQWSVVGIPLPSQHAWVRDGLLVARFNDLRLPFGDAEMRLKDAVVTAKLERSSGAPWRLTSGIIAGRASAVELAVGLLRTTDGKNQPYCNNQGVREYVFKGLCGARDIRVTKSLDGTGACDAVSLALGFDAVEAQFPTRGSPPPPVGCADLADAACP
jgi:hypothetical protein